MNILCSCISNYNEDIFKNLMNLMKKDEFYCDYHYDYKFNDKIPKQKFFFNSKNGLECNYKNIVNYNECPPIDSEILKKMSEYESIIFNMMDRNSIGNYEQRYYEYCEHIRFWNYILDKLKIELVINDVIPHGIYDYIIYCLCKIKGIVYVASFPSLFKGFSYLVSDVESNNKDWIQIYSDLKDKYNNEDIDKIILNEDFNSLWMLYKNKKMI